MRSFRWTALIGVLALTSVLGCAPDDNDPRGPNGGVIGFDAAMLDRDAGPPDLGPLPDFGPPDLGSPDLGVTRYVCRGVADSCLAQYSITTCLGLTGCRWGGDCEGISTSCYSLRSSYSCNSQDGCYWNYTGNSCSGSAWYCSSYSQGSCSGQQGCRWDSQCEGVSQGCSLMASEYTCESQAGCRWEAQ